MKLILALSALGGFLLSALVFRKIPDIGTLVEAYASALPIIYASALVVKRLTGDDVP